jgi:hypothetical protein
MKQLFVITAVIATILAIGCKDEPAESKAPESGGGPTAQFSVPFDRTLQQAQTQPKLPTAPSGYQTLPKKLPSTAPAGSISLGMLGYAIVSGGAIEFHKSGESATLQVGPDGSVDCGELIDGMIQVGFTEAEVSSQLGKLMSEIEARGIAVTNKDESKQLIADKFH